MMVCSRCDLESPPQARFCMRCGTPLDSACPRCGAAAVSGARFCGSCGAELAAPDPAVQASAAPGPAAREGEIKQITILLGELMTPTSGDAEAEDLHALLNQFVHVAREQVERFGGTVTQLLGRGFLALFGAPVAAEDHPQRAALAALQLTRRLRESEDEGPSVEARIGLASGSVIIGGPAGAIVGPAADRARRLVDLAQPGWILAGAEIAALVEPELELESLGPLPEGDAGAEPVWRVLSTARSLGAPARPRGQELSPFVGRAREMAVLEELRGQAEAGHGQVAGIAGEAGAGKSRLLIELSRTLHDRPGSRLRGHCLSYASGIPYFPFIGMVRRASRIDESDNAETAAERLRASLAAVGLGDEEHLGPLLHLLGHRDAAGGDLGDPRALQASVFAAMRRMVLAASRRNLVVMELEDLHWIDETSQEFLESLIEEIGGARALLLLTYRSGYQPRWLQKSYASQIVMRRLSPADSEAVVNAALRGREVGAETVRGIVERAEGNPFFLEELARALGDDSGLPSETPIRPPSRGS